MGEILLPFRIEDLLLKPEMAGRLRLSDDMQQTLASLVGYDDVARRLLRCSKSGTLFTTSPRISNISHITADQDTYTKQLSDIAATEIMIMAHPDNVGLVWVKNDETATVNNGWPLGPKEVVSFTVDNLNNVNILIALDTEKAIIAYTR